MGAIHLDYVQNLFSSSPINIQLLDNAQFAQLTFDQHQILMASFSDK